MGDRRDSVEALRFSEADLFHLPELTLAIYGRLETEGSHARPPRTPPPPPPNCALVINRSNNRRGSFAALDFPM